MRWDDLKYVLALYRAGTLVGAGKLLHVNTSTVGRRIEALERALGTRLFDRMGGAYHPTAKVKRVVACAEEMEIQANTLERQIQGSDTRVEGSVRITALDNFLDHIVVPALPEFLEAHPALEVTLESDLRLFELSRGEADIAVRVTEPTHPEMVTRNLGMQVTAYYQAVGQTWPDYLPLIALPNTLNHAEYNELLKKHVAGGRIVARANTEARITAMVRRGIGIGLIDCFVGEEDPELERLPGLGQIEHTLWAVTHVEMRRSARVRTVLDFLTELVSISPMTCQ